MTDQELKATLVKIIRERPAPPTTAELLQASIDIVNTVKRLKDEEPGELP